MPADASSWAIWLSLHSHSCMPCSCDLTCPQHRRDRSRCTTMAVTLAEACTGRLGWRDAGQCTPSGFLSVVASILLPAMFVQYLPAPASKAQAITVAVTTACQSMPREFARRPVDVESVAGSCRTHISMGEHHGRAAPSDLLGAPFTYITRMAVAVVWCRPSGAADRRRVLRGPNWAARASGGLCAARRGARQGALKCLASAIDQGAGSLCASTEAPAPWRI